MHESGPVLWATTTGVDRHDTGSWHPERSDRLVAVDAALRREGIGELVTPFEARQATVDELAVAHDHQYLAALQQFVAEGGGSLDPDTTLSAGSWETARWAAGAGLAAVSALEASDAVAAFVGIRPPGHHATAQQGMGFCLVNNVAVVGATLAARGERVAILDWDVHHGNGTQDIFWDDPRVLYASVHQHPAYPGSGAATEVGGSAAAGGIVNVPLPEGATGDVALAAFDEVIGPAIDAFAPTWFLISAGYDAHRADPLAALAWTAGDYALLAARVQGLMARPGRTLLFLEGGYELDALSASVAATIAALADSREGVSESPSAGGPGMEAVARALAGRERAVAGD